MRKRWLHIFDMHLYFVGVQRLRSWFALIAKIAERTYGLTKPTIYRGSKLMLLMIVNCRCHPIIRRKIDCYSLFLRTPGQTFHPAAANLLSNLGIAWTFFGLGVLATK